MFEIAELCAAVETTPGAARVVQQVEVVTHVIGWITERAPPKRGTRRKSSAKVRS